MINVIAFPAGSEAYVCSIKTAWVRLAISIATQVAAGVTSSRAVIIDDLLWRVRTLGMILSMVTAQPNMVPQVLRPRVPGRGVRALGEGERHGDPVHPARQTQSERLHRALQPHLREEVLDQHLFLRLEDVREAAYWWMIEYNEQRPHDSLGDLTPAECRQHVAGSSTSEVSA